MPKKATRRFVGLDTEEVSLVDAPANEVEFLVTKNQEDRMVQAAQTNASGAERVPVEVGDGEAVAKAMEHVNGIVANIMEMVTQKSAATESKEEASTEGDETPEEEVDTEKGSIKSILAAMGMKGDAMKTAMEKLKKAGFDPNMKFPNAKAPVSKAAEGEEEQTEDDDQVNLDSVPLTIGAIQKAAAFTPTRVSQLQSAVETLKLVLEAIGVGQVPKTRTPGVETHGNPSSTRGLAGAEKKPVMKAADGDLAAVLKSLGDAVGGLSERLEAIEKTRTASNSVEDDADNTDTDTKTQKSMWSGLL